VINIPRAKIMVRNPTIQFPLEVSPAAVTGDLYRLTMRTPAMDCDGNVFYHIWCTDINIGKC
jgi:hypothetical protein